VIRWQSLSFNRLTGGVHTGHYTDVCAAFDDAPGTLVISLDFEQYWGVRDRAPLAHYRATLLGVREVVPRLLSLFAQHSIHATWAVVGFLFFRGREELLANLPARLPRYTNPACSPYTDLACLGPDEAADPFHFAPTLIDLIRACAHQEIGTHTFSHYCCLEAGQTADDFASDLEAAMTVASARGIRSTSLVFPRNQVRADYLDICRRAGILAYRGNPTRWMYRVSGGGPLDSLRRPFRLLDTYLGFPGSNCHSLEGADGRTIVNVPASRFLRPYSRRLRALESVRLHRIKEEMRFAARHGLLYHLWWHPHDFAGNLEENMHLLETILHEFDRLRASDGMRSQTMAEVARMVLDASAHVKGC
jgi:peptidoglycan/xylan/chitin deacetylase (PgdA/CDA1 family)